MLSENSDDDDSRITTTPKSDDFFSKIQYRQASPTDILKCVEMIERDSGSNVMFSSKNDLQYRQHYAAPYFRVCVYQDENHQNGEDNIIGFITGIRFGVADNDCKALGKALTKVCPHDPNGKILGVRSLVIGSEYRKKGLGKAMITDYIETMRQINKETASKSQKKPILTIVGLFRGQEPLAFYVNNGFSVKKADDFTEAFIATDEQKNQTPAYYFELSLEHTRDSGASENKNEHKCYIVDSFASAPGTGNPAAVVLLPEAFDPKTKRSWMQKVAAEFNLSETAFCWPKDNGAGIKINNENHWNIRYFTPTVEVDLCGHATLASAAVLYQTLPDVHLASIAIVFHANEDILTMNLANDGKIDTMSSQRISKVSMTFPTKPTTEISTREDKTMVQNMLTSAFSIDIKPIYVGLSSMGDLLVEVSPESFSDIGYDSLNFMAFWEYGGYSRGTLHRVCKN